MSASSPLAKTMPPPLYFFEAWEDTPGKIRIRDGTVSYAKVEDWLQLRNDYHIECSGQSDLERAMVLRLIACDYARHPYAVGCGKTVFKNIQKTFSLHESTETTILNNNGAFGRYLSRASGSSEVDRFSLAFKIAYGINIGYDALSMTYNLKRRTTRAFVHGLLDHEIELLIKNLRLSTEKGCYRQPLLLPTLILTEHREKTEAYRVRVDDNLHAAEVHIGYAVPGLLDNTAMTLAEARERDFETFTRRLHSCSVELGTITHAGGRGKELGIYLIKTARELENLFDRSNDSDDSDFLEAQSLVQQIEFTTNLYNGLVAQAAVLKERVQNDINLMFNLVAQDNNRINRAVAMESTMIAAATKRDSAAMKSIALLTMIFLPPTFVATFFSMTMFNWSPAQSNSQSADKVASDYIWVYWVVAIPLTVVVIVVWRFWMSNGEAKRKRDIEKGKEYVLDELTGAKSSTKLEYTATGKLIAQNADDRVDKSGWYPRAPFRYQAKNTIWAE